MDQNEIKVVVGIRDKLSGELKNISTRVKAFGAELKQLAIAGAAVAAAAIASLSVAIVKVTQAAAEQQAVMERLKQALANAGISYKENTKAIDEWASAMQRATTVGDDEAKALVTQLLPFTKDLTKAMEGARLAADLSAAGLFDLNTATRNVGMVMQGNIEIMGRYVGELKASTNAELANMTAQEKSAYAIEVLKKLYGGFAEAELNTFNGRMKELKNAFGDFQESLGDAIADSPGVQAMLLTLTNAFKGLSERIGENKDGMIDWVDKTIRSTISAGTFLGKTIEGIKLVLLTLRVAVTDLAYFWGMQWEVMLIGLNGFKLGFEKMERSVLVGIRNLVTALEPMASFFKVTLADNAVSVINEKIAELDVQMGKTNMTIDVAKQTIVEYAKGMAEGNKEIADQAMKIVDVDEKAKALLATWEKNRAEILANKKRLEEHRDELTKNAAAARDLAGAVDDSTKKMSEKFATWAKNARENVTDIADVATQTMDGIADATAKGLRRAIEEGKSFSQTFKDIMRNTLFDIAEQIVRSNISNMLASIFNVGGVGGRSGGGFGNIIGGFVGRLFGGFFHQGGMVGQIPRFHDGGGFMRADERMAILQTGERVLSREEMANGAGGAGVTNIYNINAIDAASFADYVRKNKAPILGVVNEDIHNDGPTRGNIRRYAR